MNRTTLIAIALLAGAARAYEPEVHYEISREAAAQSNMQTTLRDRFGEPFGLNTVVNGRSLRNWVGQGGFDEDNPSRRCINHFHNPLSIWANAGLIGLSSIYWQQSNNVQAAIGGGDWSWPRARERYRTYLLSPNPVARNQALADIMRGLGQLAHLIQDAHSPAHTRADPHRLLDGYERYTNVIRISNPGLFDAILHAPPVRPDPAIFTATGSFPAPSRIARLIDSDTFGGGPGTYNTSGLIGSSEYTNGGYLSDDTVFRDFTMPREQAIDPVPIADRPPGRLKLRNYYRKTGDGDQLNHFVAEGTLAERLQFSYGLASYILDDATYTDAAFKLVPRAVGYSAALFDYFFQEQLEISAPAQFVYGKALYDAQGPGFGHFDKIRARVRRKAGDDRTIGSGTLTAVMRYRQLDGTGGVPFTDSFKEPDAPIRVQFDQSVSAPIAVPSVGDTFTEREFDFSQSRIPVNAVDVRLFVVFQGDVGAESDAIAVGIKDLREPDPVDYTDGSDWECFNGTLWHVADTDLFPPGVPEARDLDGNHTVDVFGPYYQTGVHVKNEDANKPLFLPSDAAYDMRIPFVDGTQGSQAMRVVILQDQDFYAGVVQMNAIHDQFSPVIRPPGVIGFDGLINDIREIPPYGVVHAYFTNSTYRGKVGFHNVVLISQPTLPCFSQTGTLKPDVTLIPAPPLEVSP